MNFSSIDKIFSPSSIVVIGASNESNSVGAKVFKNLLRGQFRGKLYAVNPKHKIVQGQPCFSSVATIMDSVDLAIIVTPAKIIPSILAECGEKGIHAAIVLSSGFSEMGEEGKIIELALHEMAQRYSIRLIGPNCLGVMRPAKKMNASFDNNAVLPGSIAFVSQSGALSAGILDWAVSRKIGFSAMVSLGNAVDVDFADMLDYFAADNETTSILLYIEGIRHPQHFMRALQNAAACKPVIVLKAGKNAVGVRAALSHTGALIGSDAVFDAALRRGGAVRVAKMEDLFLVAEILIGAKKISGNRLMIITNGGGAGVLAADRAAELAVSLMPLQADTVCELDKILPKQWSHQNPIDIIGDATPERYAAVLELCRKQENIDGMLVMLVPVAMSNPLQVAEKVIEHIQKENKLLLVCWMGERQVRSSRKLFAKYKIPCFDTPEKAVEAFHYLVMYYANQQLLKQSQVPSARIDLAMLNNTKRIIASILKQKRTLLTTIESKSLLKLFGIPVTETYAVDTVSAAILKAVEIGFPVVMKINSPDISHKSKVGGVYLNIRSVEEVQIAFDEMMQKIKTHCPGAAILGVTIEPHYQNLYDREIMIGVVKDSVFGPVISFGAGGTLVEVIGDHVLALPPLTKFAARQLVEQAKMMKPAGKLKALTSTQLEGCVQLLLSVSNMVCELSCIQEMDINPLIINETGMIAVDARIILSEEKKESQSYAHLAIKPVYS